MSSISSLLTVAVLWLFLAVFCCSGKPQKTKTLTTSERAEAQSAKDKACDTMRQLQQAGAFTKVEAGYSGVTHAYVDDEFFSIPLDAKETAMKAVALCYIALDKQDQLGLVIIHNGYSGKQIGTFSFATGLELD